MLAIVGIGLAVALSVLTTSLHHGAYEIRSGAEGSRIGEEIELGLLTLRDARDPAARDASEDFLHRQLMEAERYVGSSQERAILATMTEKVDDYIVAVARDEGDTLPAFQSAYAATREWMHINAMQGRAVNVIETRWDRIATLASLAAVSVIVVALGYLAWWMRRRVIVPALDLVRVIERYSGGERTVRARDDGADELRTVAHQFNDMAETLERQRSGQLTFLAGVAHDLRNPLTSLKLAIGMIAPDRPLPPEPRVRVLMQRISRQVDRLERMVYDLLDAARVEAGKLELVSEHVDLRDIVQATVELFEPTMRAHQLVVSLPESPVRIHCDPTRVEQVLCNLIGNAIKYSSDHSLVTVTLRQETDVATVAVTDEGPGLSSEDVTRVFEPFHRFGAVTELLPGIGLGLFVSRKIARAHGGDIAVDTVPGIGATFTLRLPVATEVHEQRAPEVSWPTS
jgi:signal transduction histidine kinase